MNRLFAKRSGNAMILTIFVIALASALIIGMLQLNTEQTLLLKNQIGLTQATAVAEAGLNDALAQLRSNINWDQGFDNKRFGSGRYTVEVAGTPPELTITSTGRANQDFTARIEARIDSEDTAAPYRIVIESFRINP